MLTIYGIKNCDTMKKAFAWLQAKGIPYSFHDYKESGVSKDKLQEWFQHLDMWQVLNIKSTTWREAPDEVKATITNSQTAIPFAIENTSVIKRPIVEFNGHYLLGFKSEEWEKLLQK